ncbi:methylmalonyl-CoA mutase [Rhodobacterales bacterium]|nr:methylmalonyl-CoA mutase [Rhodobacterales bacterium]
MPFSLTGPDSFYAADETTWWDAVDKALKGAPRKRLYGETEDGLEIAPLYQRRTDLPARALRTGQDWTVVQRIDIPDPAQANAQILRDLENGAGGLDLVFAGAPSAHGNGILVETVEGLEALFDGVQLDLIELRLDAGERSVEHLALLLAYLERKGIDPASVDVAAGTDPFGWIALNGLMPSEPQISDRYLKDMVASVDRSGSPARLFNADGRVWHGAGGTPAQELALVLSSAAANLRLLEAAGLAPETWADRISISLVADADQFGTIAKARAFRALWACVLDGAQLPQTPARVHMSTSYRMLTRQDPWVNLLRNTVAAFAAGIGGADSVCVLPHTLAVGLPDGLARRLARNTQSILLEESNLAKVADPAAGSGALEDRTEKLCLSAWEMFQEIEGAGGLEAALGSGLVQRRIEEAAAALDRSVAFRKRPITGVSEFPDLSEKAVSVLEPSAKEPATTSAALDLPPPGDGAWFDALRRAALGGYSLPSPVRELAKPDNSVTVQKLRPMRVAEPFERLREAAAAAEERSGEAPKVFLASLGTLAQFSARASWTSNAFSAGGVTPVGPAVYETLEDLETAFRSSGAVIACLVSSDEVYETQAEEAARLLNDAGAEHVYLAGKAGEKEDSYLASGIDRFLYAGCDLLALLCEVHKRLGLDRDADTTRLEVSS